MYLNWYHLLPVGQRLEIEQSPVDRHWMNETFQKYSYRCLPMTYANRHGWCIRAPHDIEVVWHGGTSPESTEILSGRLTEHGARFADNGTGNGIVTFHISAIPRTSPEYSLWILPAPNLVVPGASPLSGIVESDWMFSSPSMNWKLTEPGKTVVFKKGDPVFFFIPVHKTYLEDFSVSHLSIHDDPNMYQRFADHISWRDEKARNNEPVFGKSYMRGENPDGSTPQWEHTHKTRIELSQPSSNE